MPSNDAATDDVEAWHAAMVEESTIYLNVTACCCGIPRPVHPLANVTAALRWRIFPVDGFLIS